jgi:hypothetical protein
MVCKKLRLIIGIDIIIYFMSMSWNLHDEGDSLVRQACKITLGCNFTENFPPPFSLLHVYYCDVENFN